jgi:hypothetical protein
MKLTASQLRKIIAEETKKALREGATDGGNWNSVVDAAVTAFYDAAPTYDRNDPSMRANGPTGWSEQLEGAAEDFRNEVGIALDKIVEKLHNGDYFI